VKKLSSVSCGQPQKLPYRLNEKIVLSSSAITNTPKATATQSFLSSTFPCSRAFNIQHTSTTRTPTNNTICLLKSNGSVVNGRKTIGTRAATIYSVQRITESKILRESSF